MIKNIAIGGSNLTLLILAILMGLACAAFVGVFLSRLDTSDGGGGTSSASLPVVVAAAPIPAQTTITAEMLTVKEVPVELALAGAFAEVAPVVGKRTQVQIVTGEQILPTNAIDPDAAQDVFGPNAPLSLVVPPGQRAFAVYVSSVAAVGGLARPGDHIDLMSTNESSAENSESVEACVVMQNVTVLAIGAGLLNTGTDASAISSVSPQPDANTMTLAVSPEQAIQLATIQRTISDSSVGHQLWVSLRPYGDTSVASTPACNTSTGQ